MLKKTMTFMDYSEPPKQVTQDFYFNLTIMEITEMEIEYGGLEETIKRLSKEQNLKEAYNIFKDFLLRAYGHRTDDGRGFPKEDEFGRPYSRELRASPALSDIVMDLLSNPESGGEFMEACLPADKIALAKEEAAKRPQEPKSTVTLELVDENHGVEVAPKRVEETITRLTFNDFTKEALLEMPEEQFKAILPSDPKKMTKDQLLIAFERKSKQQ